ALMNSNRMPPRIFSQPVGTEGSNSKGFPSVGHTGAGAGLGERASAASVSKVGHWNVCSHFGQQICLSKMLSGIASSALQFGQAILPGMVEFLFWPFAALRPAKTANPEAASGRSSIVYDTQLASPVQGSHTRHTHQSQSGSLHSIRC